MKTLILLFLTLFIITSCSTGRIVNGYKSKSKIEKGETTRHVSKHKIQKSKQESCTTIASNVIPKDKDLKPADNSTNINRQYADAQNDREIRATINSKTIDSDAEYGDSPISQGFVQNEHEISTSTPDEEPTTEVVEEDTRRLDPLSITSFGLAVLGIPTIVISFILIDFSFMFPVILGLAALMLIAAFVLGLIAIIRKKRNRKKYKGVAFAIIGMAIASVGIGFLLLILLFMLTY